MPSIFLSYRREDTEDPAGRLFDVLVRQYGQDSVFLDVAAIRIGRNFRLEIESSVSTCSVLLALIGPHWLDEKNKARLDDPDDFVRLEIAAALKRDVPVVPVLVHGATMPRPDQLPEDLKELAYRNGVELTHARYNSDVDLLLKALDLYLVTAPAPRKHWWQSRITIQVSVAIAALMVVAVYLGVNRTSEVTNPEGTNMGLAPTIQTTSPAANPIPAPIQKTKQSSSADGPSVPNFAGTWNGYEETTPEGITRPFSRQLVITQSGSTITFPQFNHTYPINHDGIVTYQQFAAGDSGTGHEVATADEADLVNTTTWRLEGSILTLQVISETRHPYAGQPVGTKISTTRFRR